MTQSMESSSHGAALAALLAAGIGAAALGLVVLMNEAGIFTAPSLYAPVGGLSGRSTIAVVVWLIAWFFLHRRWDQRPAPAAAFGWSLALVAFALITTFPPVWSLF